MPARQLDPTVRDETHEIAAEALRNAFRHSAAQVEVELRYGARELRLRVRDDGEGIDRTVLHGGRQGHFGLCGMRERAEFVGGSQCAVAFQPKCAPR